MKRKVDRLAAVFVLLQLLFSCVSVPDGQVTLNVIPAPAEVYEGSGGDFILDEKTVFSVSTPEEESVADFYADRIAVSAGFRPAVLKTPVAENYIRLSIAPESVVPEGYLLESDRNRIEIRGGARSGIFYGMATLMQLLPDEAADSAVAKTGKWKVPSLRIGDFPRFPYRGIHLDPCRHFIPISVLKRNIDVLAQYKINHLHLHLTEDQGWRIEIRKYPELVRKGAVRVEGEGSVHEGYYTQEQLRDLVKYAADRCVTIVPEIELPGHALSAIAACPELSCRGKKVQQPRNIWGVEDVVMCAGKESTFRFIENVIREVVEIFPSPYIHIGGDECPKTAWESCPLCQRRIAEQGLENGEDGHTPEERLQSYFIKRVEKIVAQYGRRIIGWDEILEGGLPETAAVMSWRGLSGGIEAAAQGRDVIMTPSSDGMYFDHYQGDSRVEPTGIGGYAPLEKVYAYDPVPDTLVKLHKDSHVLGVQANNWSEYYYEPEIMEYRLYPRALALAEIAWSFPENKDFTDFCRRVDGSACRRLEYAGVRFHIPLPEQPGGSSDHIAFLDRTRLEFTTTRPVKMVYTLDGKDPDLHSEIYREPLEIDETAVLKIRSVLPSGQLSAVRTIRLQQEELRAPASAATAEPGLMMKMTEGMFLTREDLLREDRSWVSRPIAGTSDLRAQRAGDGTWNYAACATGYLVIPEDGIYEFYSNLNDVAVDGVRIVDNDGQPKRFSRSGGSMALAAGPHRIEATFLGHVIGGVPSSWDGGEILIRKEGEQDFRPVDPEMYRR